jgi:hypothetical protein
MAARTPPRYVPTLTEVVKDVAPAALTPPTLSQEQLVHRIMQRVDVTLERRLREAVAAVVLEHTRALGPALRDEIQAMVSDAVAQALADELVSQQRPGPAAR